MKASTTVLSQNNICKEQLPSLLRFAGNFHVQLHILLLLLFYNFLEKTKHIQTKTIAFSVKDYKRLYIAQY